MDRPPRGRRPAAARRLASSRRPHQRPSGRRRGLRRRGPSVALAANASNPSSSPTGPPTTSCRRDYLGCPTAIRRTSSWGWAVGTPVSGPERTTICICGPPRKPEVSVMWPPCWPPDGGPVGRPATNPPSRTTRWPTPSPVDSKPGGPCPAPTAATTSTMTSATSSTVGRRSTSSSPPGTGSIYSEACIDSITTRSTYRSYRITVVDNDSVEDATRRFLERGDLRVVPAPGPFNFSRLVNAGVRASDADYVLLLNNDVTVLTADWIEAMLEVGQRPGVGAVGCRLLFPDGSVQHEGVALITEVRGGQRELAVAGDQEHVSGDGRLHARPPGRLLVDRRVRRGDGRRLQRRGLLPAHGPLRSTGGVHPPCRAGARRELQPGKGQSAVRHRPVPRAVGHPENGCRTPTSAPTSCGRTPAPADGRRPGDGRVLTAPPGRWAGYYFCHRAPSRSMAASTTASSENRAAMVWAAAAPRRLRRSASAARARIHLAAWSMSGSAHKNPWR